MSAVATKPIQFGATVQFVFTVLDQDGDPLPLLATDTLTAFFTPPSGTLKTFPGTLLTDGSDAKFFYTTSGADIDEEKTWSRQGLVVRGGAIHPTEVKKFQVAANLF